MFCDDMRICVMATLFCVMTLDVGSQDHLATLGISEGRAKEAVFDSFMSDAVSIAGKPAAFIGMSAQGRVALVNFALNLARDQDRSHQRHTRRLKSVHRSTEA